MEIGIGMPVSTGIELEGRLAIGERPEVAIIAHPHPEYGGSMDNNVVLAAREVAGALGMSTLRFNFRGVGASSGRYDDGIGEVDDMLVAVETARRRAANDSRVHLVAYSFGAWIAAKTVTRGLRVDTATLISPPVDFLAFGELGLPDCPCQVITGAKDEYGSPASVNAWLDRLPGAPKLQIVPGADHFYFGMEASLVALLGGFLS
ncbi:MAG: alpha/beta hydrolase [Myxococcota bacterium]|jgi:hypothetical protein|nr:alpha/beta hydrolase [Myxococcota bacterium]